MKNRIKEVVKKFGFKLIKSIPQKNYYIIYTPRGVFCLKKVDYDISEILFIHNAKEHLIYNDFKSIDRYITLEGIPYIKYGEDYYVMTKWIRGRSYNYNDLSEIEKASKTLASFHNASRNYNPGVEGESRSNIGKLQQNYLERCEDYIYMKNLIKMKSFKDRIDILFLRHADMFYDMGIEAVKALQKNGYFQACKEEGMQGYLCHNDYNYNNIVIDRNGELNIINFDYCKFELRCFDIASLIIDVMNRLNWKLEVALQILKAYDSMRKIEGREYKLIASFLQFPQDIWEIATGYYYGQNHRFKYRYYIDLKDRIEKIPYKTEFLKKYIDILA